MGEVVSVIDRVIVGAMAVTLAFVVYVLFRATFRDCARTEIGAYNERVGKSLRPAYGEHCVEWKWGWE